MSSTGGLKLNQTATDGGQRIKGEYVLRNGGNDSVQKLVKQRKTMHDLGYDRATLTGTTTNASNYDAYAIDYNKFMHKR